MASSHDDYPYSAHPSTALRPTPAHGLAGTAAHFTRTKIKRMSKFRKALLMSLLVVTPLGFFVKWYAPVNLMADVLYEIFWILGFLFIFPKGSPLKVSSWVFVVTCALEVLQLWHPLFLEVFRSSFLGGTLIGRTFLWVQFPFYVAGCVAGFLWVKWLKSKASS
jgi:hypothetical protein